KVSCWRLAFSKLPKAPTDTRYGASSSAEALAGGPLAAGGWLLAWDDDDDCDAELLTELGDGLAGEAGASALASGASASTDDDRAGSSDGCWALDDWSG